MKLSIASIVTIAATSFAVSAGEVAPTEISFSDGAIENSLTGVPGDPVAGREIVIDRSIANCVACHAANDYAEVQFHGNIGPPLDGAGDRWSEAELRGLVVDAKQMFEGTMMPSFYKTEGFIRPGNRYTGEAADDTFGPLLTAQQVEDVVAYLVTLDEY